MLLGVHDAVALPLALPLPDKDSLGLELGVLLAVWVPDVEREADKDVDGVCEQVLVPVPVPLEVGEGLGVLEGERALDADRDTDVVLLSLRPALRLC